MKLAVYGQFVSEKNRRENTDLPWCVKGNFLSKKEIEVYSSRNITGES